MVGVNVIFILVLAMSLAPFVWGIDDAISYKIKVSKKCDKTKNRLIKFFAIFMVLVYAILVGIFWLLSDLLNKVDFGGYIKVILYTLVLGVLSSEIIYQSPKQEINSAWDAFKSGLTKANVNNFWANMPLNVIINLFYLIVLILAQVDDLGYCEFSKGGSLFLTLNKYGIVILFAVQKIIKSVVPDKARAKIMLEAFVEKENEEEIQKQKRKEQNDAKEQRKKDKME